MQNLAAHSANERFFFVEADDADGLFVPLAPVPEAVGLIHAIVHLAAQTNVQRSVDCPLSDARTPARAGDIRHSCPDVSAAAALGFRPRVGIEPGLADTVA